MNVNLDVKEITLDLPVDEECPSKKGLLQLLQQKTKLNFQEPPIIVSGIEERS